MKSNDVSLSLLLLAFSIRPVHSVVGCPSPTTDGCGMPSGKNWIPRWAMRSSLYTYCFIHCPLAFFKANKNLGVFDGIVAFDHYWTNQGMPCINGIPQEFAAQDAITLSTKADFPGARVIQYRIGTAVPYAEVVHTAMVEHPEWFVRWHHPPNDNMTVCTVSPEARTGRPGDNCSWEIRAGMYDFTQPEVQTWWVDNIIKPTMVYADGKSTVVSSKTSFLVQAYFVECIDHNYFVETHKMATQRLTSAALFYLYQLALQSSFFPSISVFSVSLLEGERRVRFAVDGSAGGGGCGSSFFHPKLRVPWGRPVLSRVAEESTQRGKEDMMLGTPPEGEDATKAFKTS